MAFREVIEAVLKVKDANRFKAGMAGAARSVRKFGHDADETATQTEILKNIEEKLARQSLELTAALTVVAHSVNDLGDEMEKTAAKSLVANQVMKKSGSNAVFLGKSWAFWKDRLSLTRSELMTTALTISAYFSPAIIALGSSFAYAALGGGGVAFGGLASFVLGLGSLLAILKPVKDNIDKVMKAQDQYNVAVAQYGAQSKQASAASAHLFAIVQTQGGKPIMDLVTSLRSFSTEWKKLTAPGQASLIEVMTGGLGAGKTLLPALTTGANSIARQIQDTMKGAFKTLSGGEFQGILRSLFQTFDKAIGPGIRGAVNLIMVLGRIAVATGPWVVKWAQAWERTTKSWRSGTKDTTKLDRFFKGAVTHFKAWWGLAKAVGRVLKTIFGVSKDQGLDFVYVLTGLVNKFDDWLIKMRDTGRIKQFWETWRKSIDTAFFIFSHPGEAFQRYFPGFLAAIDTYLPQVMNHIATTVGTAGPIVAETFIKAFLGAGPWAQFFTVSILARRMGVFKKLGGILAGTFVTPFIRTFSRAFIAAMGFQFAEEGAIGAAMGRNGARIGKVFGKAFAGGVILGIALYGPGFARKVSDKIADLLGQSRARPDRPPGTPGSGGPNILDWLAGQLPDIPDLNPFGGPKHKKRKGATGGIRGGVPGGAGGGVIPMGGAALVGENGPELASMSPWGTRVMPLAGNSRHTLPGVMNVPSLENSLNVTVRSHLHVDKREIARAVSDQVAYEATRRGGRPIGGNRKD